MTGSGAPEGARIALIRARLQSALTPTVLEIHDESAAHHGHAGAASGGGHFRVVIHSPRFAGQGLVARHRMVYGALGELMGTEIHALALETPVS